MILRVTTSLDQLSKAIDGLVSMSNELETVIINISLLIYYKSFYYFIVTKFDI